ncbi:MAG: RNase adaptor protein RapZ [Deltaproteobacteria bacterium RBG_13_52_11]|nr:MAG: RNase adaptor protein RapZ [Deltaproteobacteria bacterium RBG_13_52_11]
MQITIISGLSGSGKSTAMRALEDSGFYCIDNMPAILIPTFIELCQHSTGGLSRVAIAVDIRGKEFLEDFQKVIQDLRGKGHEIKILFLESSNEVLIRRYSETRRSHPVEKEQGITLPDAVKEERGEMAFLREIADEVIDTSDLNVHQLRGIIMERLMTSPAKGMKATLLSFGYSYGLPVEADIVMDVRLLPNPFFIRELRGLTGKDKKVRDYVLKQKETTEFLHRFSEMIEYLIPLYEKEGKSYLTIAIGCTGGKHRSVVITEHLASMVGQQGKEVTVRHRDIERG